MPQMWDEFAVDELRMLLAEHRGAAEDLMDRAHDLAVKLPGTMALFRAGRLPESRVKIIVYATAPLDPAEARAAEELVLGRAGRLTPGGLRHAIARAVMEVAPDKARKRREAAAERRPGPAVGRGQRERGADGAGTAARRGPGRRSADHRVGARAAQGAGLRARWTNSAPGRTWTCCWARTPARRRRVTAEPAVAAGLMAPEAVARPGRERRGRVVRGPA